MDIASLAATVVGSFLVPLAKEGLKKIKEQVSGLIEQAGEAAGEAAADTIGGVRDKVASLFTSDDDKVILETFESHPDAGAALLEVKLTEKLEEDSEAAEELEKLVTADVPGGGGVSLSHIMADTFGYVDARGAHVSGGAQIGGVIMNAPAAPIGSKFADPPRNARPEDDEAEA